MISDYDERDASGLLDHKWMRRHDSLGTAGRYEKSAHAMRRRVVVFWVCGCFAWPLSAQEGLYQQVVRPILARKCFACHGPDEAQRKADLRLDQRDVAVATGAITPGEPAASKLIERIFSTDPQQQMPPADASTQLTDEEKETLRQWITAGAEYPLHWAFVPPRKPDLPPRLETTRARRGIDRFIEHGLVESGMTLADSADRYRLIRRLYLDLVGLPPSPTAADLFAHDPRPDAWERLVDQVLSSPHYGERWARAWLDLARYSDTNGYEKDRPRSIWPYRDWVIDALNADMPFDQFSIEQLAGDMLPHATNRQLIATGFHRNTMLNEEGGIDPLEYRFYAMVDRVATTGTVWMGLTIGCAQCHSHKYDPLSQQDYYSLLALLNNADEPDLTVADAGIEARRHELTEQIARLQADLENQFPPAEGEGTVAARRQANLQAKFHAWRDQEAAGAVPWTVLRPQGLTTNLPKLTLQEDGSVFASGDFTKRDLYTLEFSSTAFQEAGIQELSGLRLEVMPDERLPAQGPGIVYYEGRQGDFFLSEFTATVGDVPQAFAAASIDYGKHYIGDDQASGEDVIDQDGSTGWAVAEATGQAHQLVLAFAQPVATDQGMVVQLLFERHYAASLGRFRISGTATSQPLQAKSLPVEIESFLAEDVSTWDDRTRQQVRDYYLQVAAELAPAREAVAALRKQLPQAPSTLVMRERPGDHPRPTFRRQRGEWTSPREEVAPQIPTIFRDREGDQPLPTNRLEFARWLVSEQNPLVARVTVNRAWRVFFGRGLVQTNGDFGTQSESPTHPELLDWLACQFVQQGYSVKQLHRSLVSSATYRQTAHVSPDQFQRDPQNRWYARGPRQRVPAEMVRDIALVASGRMSTIMKGPSVFPPQLDAVNELAWGKPKWSTSKGADRYRRSIYTHRKRTTPFAAFTVFDGPSGENCTARRDHSNTPLQALTLLNDAMFVELARAAAAEISTLQTVEEQATALFRRFLTRPPTPAERAALVAYFEAQQARIASGELEVNLLLEQPGADQRLSERRALYRRRLLEEKWAKAKQTQGEPPPADLELPVTQGLSLWLRADQELFVDQEGAQTATLGEPVALWRDQCVGENSLANHALQPRPAERPLLVDGFGRYGRRAVRFTPSQRSHLRIADEASLRTEGVGLTIFVTYQLHEIPTSDVQIVTKYAEDGTSHGNWGVDLFHLAGKPANRPRLYLGNPKRPGEYGGGVAMVRGLSERLPHQLTCLYNAGQAAIRLDGQAAAIENAAVAPPDPAFNAEDPVDLLVGARVVTKNDAGSFFPGDIGEILVYRRALENAELVAVEAYLSRKFGAPIEISENELAAALAIDPQAAVWQQELSAAAAWTMLARAIMNFDETITKP